MNGKVIAGKLHVIEKGKKVKGQKGLTHTATVAAPVGAGRALPLHRDATNPHTTTTVAPRKGVARNAPTSQRAANPTITYMATDNVWHTPYYNDTYNNPYGGGFRVRR